jgi:hypothetical protein
MRISGAINRAIPAREILQRPRPKVNRSDMVSRIMPIDILQADSLLSVARKEGRMQAYCMKCRAKREIRNPRSIVMKNGRPATQGVCPTCGTKVFRIGKG